MSPEQVVEELAQLPPGDVLFTDDNFLADIPRVLHIIALLNRNGSHGDVSLSRPEAILLWNIRS